jgi:hypothetical protein
MNQEALGMKQLWPRQSTIIAFAWRDLRKTASLSQDSWCHNQDSNQAPPEYKSRTLLLHQPALL